MSTTAPLTETVEAAKVETPVVKEKKAISDAKAASLAKARESKKQKALLKKQQEMEGVLSSKAPPAAEQQTVSQNDDDDAEIDFDQILHALDNTQSSKKIDQIFSLVEELKEMKLKAKEKKKLKKAKQQGTKTTTVAQTPKLNPKAVKAKETIKAIALTD